MHRVLPSRTVDSSVFYANSLHTGGADFSPKLLNGRDKRSDGFYTKSLHISRGGLIRKGRWFHYRRRVPDALRTVLGRSEIWVSLKTPNHDVASVRAQIVADAVEYEFGRAHFIDGPANAPRVGRRNAKLLSTLAANLAQLKNATPVTPSDAKASRQGLSDVYRLYLADPRHHRCARTMASYDTTGRWIAEFFGGETPVPQITREQCRAFVRFLQRVPKNAQKRFPQLTLIEAVEVTSELPDVERINAANVNAYLNKFAGALNWAEQEGFIDRNPARGLRVADPVKKRDKRRPFSMGQLERIFRAPIYVGCVDDSNGYARRGPNVIRRARFWIPLIGLFSGLRLNEICQLDLADVVVLDDVLCFTIRDDSPHGVTDKRVKSDASERVVPVHAALRRFGFAAYIAERRQAGCDKLFPELSVGSTGYHSKGFSQWFSRFLATCEAKEPLTCFHSFRHNFRDGLRASGISREISLALGGWSSGIISSEVADAYGSGFPPKVLLDAIDQVHFDIDVSHLSASH